jgi:peptide deformylase
VSQSPTDAPDAADSPAPILLLGDPRLRCVSSPVEDVAGTVARDGRRLAATLAAFRRTHGFGRALSAPQIGIARRIVAIDLGTGPRLLLNPEIVWASEERITMWDDCMSFPGLLVRVARRRSISVRFLDETGAEGVWERLDAPTSELLQHEIDHLNGVLAVDRAIDREALVLREAFDADPDAFLSLVDYVIPVPAYRR